jgi:hypothetical protein
MKITICFIVLLSLLVFSFGCSKTSESSTVTYKTFVLKANDIRLRNLQHPLYSFEYPSIFEFNDVTPPFQKGFNGPMIPSDTSEISSFAETDLYHASLGVQVSKRHRFFASAAEKFDDNISYAYLYGDNITAKKVTISGIIADYIEFSRTEKLNTSDGLVNTRESFRRVFFEYADLIWTIGMNWSSIDPEPLEIQVYFDHLIETFKIKK